ncbi:UNVERIFIED_CONTAM: hypothetical protein RMT77_011962 [Armadillidium vulgare]
MPISGVGEPDFNIQMKNLQRRQKELDPVDVCIVTCYNCFKGKLLLFCANQCIMRTAKLPEIWLYLCPYFNY